MSAVTDLVDVLLLRSLPPKAAHRFVPGRQCFRQAPFVRQFRAALNQIIRGSRVRRRGRRWPGQSGAMDPASDSSSSRCGAKTGSSTSRSNAAL